MTTTRTFRTTFSPSYVAESIIEILHFRDMTFGADELVSIYLETANAIVDMSSFNIGKIPNITGDESEIEQSMLISKAEAESNKIGVRILSRKNNTGTWDEIAEFILLNFGRKDYLDLRTKLGYPSKILEKNDAIAIQLIDYGDGLLWDTDRISIDMAVSVEILKKNNVDALTARISALELALEGRLVNLPANSLLGKGAVAGTVEVIPRSTFVDTATDQTIGGVKTYSKNLIASGKIIPNQSPLIDWGIDFSTGGSTITLAPTATYDLATGSGMVVIYDNGDGNFNLMFAAGGGVVSASATASSSIVAGIPSPEKVGLFYNPATGKYRILNNRSTSRTLILSTIKMRAFS